MKRALEPARQVLADLHDSAYQWSLACCRFDENSAREVVRITALRLAAPGERVIA